MTDYSIIIPVYFNEIVVSITTDVIYKEVLTKMENLDCEIIFVDDGSEDDSFHELVKLQQRYPAIIKVVKLTRNFGQVNAIMAGLSLASGKCAVIMSADNQDPAELIIDMLDAFFNEHFDIVICSRKGRDESFLRKWTSNVFYYIMRKISFANMPSGGFDYVLLSRRVFKIILRNQETNLFFQGQILWTGFKTKFIEYHRRKREIGKSRWTFEKKLTYLIDGVMGYSFLPIRVISVIGIIIAFLGFIYALIIFAIRIFWGLPVEGFAPLMITILVIGGLQMIMLGIIGEYLWRVLAQTRNRDPYIIESIHGDFPLDGLIPLSKKDINKSYES
jgi:glycosyltransferase involved in cell wall biosynthesis